MENFDSEWVMQWKRDAEKVLVQTRMFWKIQPEIHSILVLYLFSSYSMLLLTLGVFFFFWI